MTERQDDHSIACGVFTNDDGLCTCKEDSSAAKPPSKRMKKAVEKFQNDMEKLGLGVSISINDEPSVVIVEPPKEDEDAA